MYFVIFVVESDNSNQTNGPKGQRDGPTDAGATTCDQGYFSLETCHIHLMHITLGARIQEPGARREDRVEVRISDFEVRISNLKM